ADLLNYTQEDLLEIKDFDKKLVEEVVEVLQSRFGISLPQEGLYIPASSIKEKLRDFLQEVDETSTKSIEEKDDLTAQTPIELLQLSVRAYNRLKQMQINTLADLLNYTQEDLLEIKDFDKKLVEEVAEALQSRFGISLPQERLYIPASSIKGKLRDFLKEADETLTKSIKEKDALTAQIPIEELQLSVRTYNCLKRVQVNSIADLLDYTQEDLLEIRNFGRKSVEDVVEALQRRLGITLTPKRSS
ncbi:DNA-directed RNA polymerase subunit alpha C-terminal domain-containing protein, partial [Scytonema sp. NUACC26]|uniref:DNA-directed RNA polymerase subunit alpha C-terminal domain-containing protein n=1 Tax=Scytonema sp. NUACC26 TaxID=3140176 RepID=UPI0038B3C4E3